MFFGNINNGATFKKKSLSRGSSRYTRDKEKGIKAYHYGKSSQRKASKEEERNKETTKEPENNKMALVSPYLINLNANGLNYVIKRHRVAEWIKKQDPTICCLPAIHFRAKDTQTESEGMEEDISCGWK